MTKHTTRAALTNRPKAFSYVRFSTPEQAKGDSFRRQTEAAERYAALHGLDMDTKFSFYDAGVSAFRGRNAADGMLGEFLSFVKSGDVPQGSFLLVEHLDRVSRENALDAFDTLKDIAKAGVSVVTMSDGKQYSHASLRQNPMDMMWAIMQFSAANEESAKKGKRVGEAWANKRRLAGSKPLTALCPGWVRLRDDRSAYDLVPERAAIVRRVFDMTLAGKGQHAIAETFNREGVPVFGRGKHWHRTYVAKMLSDPSTIGSHTPHRVEVIAGNKVRTPTDTVEGYFPAVIDRETFDRVAALSSGRPSQRGGNGSIANILAGLAACPQCDATMTRVNKGGKKGGKPYLVCTAAKAGKGCDYRQVRLEDVTTTIIEKAGELFGLLPSTDADLQEQWERMTAADGGVGDEIDNIVAAIEEGGHSPALLAQLRRQEAARDDIRRTIADLEDRIADTLTNRVQDTLGRLVDATEVEVRDVPTINATLRQLFDRVVVDYAQGYLRFHWKHAPGEVSSLMYAWPKEAA